jgi:hypothetical protein
MKKSFIVLLVVSLIFVLAVGSVYVYFLFNGKKILLEQIEKNLGVKAEVSSLNVVFPSWIVIDHFKVGDYLNVDQISVAPSFWGFLKGDIVFDSIIIRNPKFKITRKKDGGIDLGFAIYKKGKIILPQKSVPKVEAVSQQPVAASVTTPQRKHKKLFYFGQLKVINGSGEFVDQALLQEAPFVTRFARLNLDASRTSIITPLKMQFKLKGNFTSENGETVGDVSSSGWVDITTKDMDVKTKINRLRLVNFGPYYKKYLKQDLKSGDMFLTAATTASNNDLKADCHMELANVAFTNPQEYTTMNAQDIGALMIQSMLTTQGQAIFDFSFKTKLDNPKLEHIKLKGSFFQAKMKDMMSHPEESQAKIEEISKQFKDIGKEFKKMFKSK